MASGPHPTSTAAAASASSAAPSAGGSSSGTTTTTTTTTGGILIGDRLYSEVSLTIDHSLIPEERLSPTPSMQDGLDLPSETDLRILGCELIQAAGILLRLPQVAMATGQVLFHRFFYSKSFVKHSFEIVAMACINLASKIEEAPRRIRDVINVFHHLRQLRGKSTTSYIYQSLGDVEWYIEMKLSSWQQTPSPLILDQNYINTKNQVIKAERRVLKELGFCVHVKHPHKIIVMYLQVLECERNQTLVQTAWNYMNDSLRTNVFVRFQPETIACACIYLAARALQIPLPARPHWFLLFGTTEEEIQEICIETLRLYTRKKPNYELLEKEVEKRKVALQEAKLKAKGLNLDGTPALSTLGGFSPASKPSSPREVKAEEKSPVSINVKTVKKEPEDRQQASKSPYNGVRKDSKRSRNSRSASRSRSRTRSRSRSHTPRRQVIIIGEVGLEHTAQDQEAGLAATVKALDDIIIMVLLILRPNIPEKI
ncbi:Cyclin-L1 [Apodemus speciosus]|uniref:Cyclin-L1 n=1 Tax=Apodemus speciosus TaxID=105296 RepID=A0ABQ0ELE6_APOSI